MVVRPKCPISNGRTTVRPNSKKCSFPTFFVMLDMEKFVMKNPKKEVYSSQKVFKEVK